MLHHQDQHMNSSYGGSDSASSSLQNRKYDKDGNFNFLSGKEENFNLEGSETGGDENRNQVRPRSLGPLGRDPAAAAAAAAPAPGYHGNSGLTSPRSRTAAWSRLEPLPEVEGGDDYGRFPPDGAEERRTGEEEEGGGGAGREAELQKRKELQRRISFRGPEDEDSEYSDSDSDSSLRLEGVAGGGGGGGGGGVLMSGWDRVGVGEPRRGPRDAEPRRALARRSLSGCGLGDVKEEGPEPEEGAEPGDRSSDSDGEGAELMEAVWTLRDRERFKAQEMEKHQVQLTMYRRLALIRWVRTLQNRVLEQQNRLQSSFDVILTHRKELLRMGAASVAAPAPPTAAVGQS